MQSRAIKKIFQNGFWLSLLLHLLLLLAVLILMARKPEETVEKTLPQNYVPAYTYTGSIKPATPQQAVQSTQTKESHPNPEKIISPEKEESSESIQSVEHTSSTFEAPKVVKKIPVKKIRNKPLQKSLLSASFDMLKQEQLQEISTKGEADPIYMIGDDSQPADPLIKLLGRSLSAHFAYPRTAGELGIRGRVLIGMTLHPEGYYSNVKMMQSSENPDLDAATLYAVNSAPKIEGADRFISKPKRFVIGFIFN